VKQGVPSFSAELILFSSYNKITPFKRRDIKVNKVDYDRALYYTHRSEWDNLLILMVRTKDDLLSKRIEQFLHAYHFSKDYTVVERSLYTLLRYIEHANYTFSVEQPLEETFAEM
jgi:YhdB-like protein